MVGEASVVGFLLEGEEHPLMVDRYMDYGNKGCRFSKRGWIETYSQRQCMIERPLKKLASHWQGYQDVMRIDC
jgi:hypothetical protein